MLLLAVLLLAEMMRRDDIENEVPTLPILLFWESDILPFVSQLASPKSECRPESNLKPSVNSSVLNFGNDEELSPLQRGEWHGLAIVVRGVLRADHL